MNTNAKAGDVIFAGGNYILLTDDPTYNDYWKHFYGWGKRWIKSKRKFSGNVLLHSFNHHEILTEKEKEQLI